MRQLVLMVFLALPTTKLSCNGTGEFFCWWWTLFEINCLIFPIIHVLPPETRSPSIHSYHILWKLFSLSTDKWGFYSPKIVEGEKKTTPLNCSLSLERICCSQKTFMVLCQWIRASTIEKWIPVHVSCKTKIKITQIWGLWTSHAYFKCWHFSKEMLCPYTEQDRRGCATEKMCILELDLQVNLDKIVECR